jgi:hypothetical protein
MRLFRRRHCKPAAPPELILHVGRHKTGSSSLQRLLGDKCDVLRQRGILYPRSGRVADQHMGLPAAALGGHPALPQEFTTDLEQLKVALLREFEEEGSRTGLMSSEVFCELAFRQPDACRTLLAWLSERFRCWVIQVVRDPHSYGVSAVKHQLRQNGLGEWTPLSWYRRCQHKHATLDRFWSNCGLPLITLPYDPENVVSGVLDVIEQMTGREGLARQLVGWNRAKVPWLNTDPGPSAPYILYLMHHAGCPHGTAMTYPDFLTLLQEQRPVLQEAIHPCREPELDAALNVLFAGAPERALPAEEEQHYLESTAAFSLMREAHASLTVHQRRP